MATSAVVGSLRVNLGLDSAQFQAGLQNAAGRLRVARTQFLAFSAAAVAALTGVFAAARAGANDIDATVKEARRLGASVGAFEAVRMVADEAGVSVDTLADDLQSMDRVLSTVGRGGAGADALARLGLSAADLSRMDVDQKIATISDRIRDLGLSTGQTTQLLRDLGIRNRDMVLLMMAGGAAIRSARQDVQDYGLALSQVQTDAIEVANDRIGRLGIIGRYVGQQLAVQLIPPLGALSQALTNSLRPGGMLRTVLDGLIRVVSGVVGFLGDLVTIIVECGRWLGGLVAQVVAAVGEFTGLGEVLSWIAQNNPLTWVVNGVDWFADLIRAAGSFGSAMGLLKDVAVEVWGRIGYSFSAMGARLNAVWYEIKAASLDALAGVVDYALTAGNRIVGVFRGAFGAIKAIWGQLPAAIGDFAYQAANALIGGVEAMLNAVVARINGFISGMNAALALLPEWATGGEPLAIGVIPDISLGRIANEFEGQAAAAGEAAAGAFREGFETDTFASPDAANSLRDMAEGERANAAGQNAAADIYHMLEGQPLTSVNALTAAMTAAGAATDATVESTDSLAESLDGGGGGGGSGGIAGAAQNATTELTAMQQAAKRGADTIAEAFGALIDKSKSWKDVLVDILKKIRDFQLEKAFQSLASANGGNNIFGWLGSLMGANADGTRNFGGGWTRINERGGEIANLPSGTQIIPHDISQRMADRSAVQQTAQVEIIPSPYFDARVDGRAARVTGAGMQMQSRATRSTFMSQNERYG